MSDVLPLKDTIIYGPVRSRRLGRSLGINLLPAGRKWCTFDCQYCQYGWTPAGGKNAGRGDAGFPSVDDIVRAVESSVLSLEEPPAYLTFSGNGEPTLHPDFPRIVDAVKTLRDRIAPHARTAVLSNSTRIGDKTIRAAVARLDRPILKLDAGNERVFRSYNRPAPGIEFDDIVSGLAKLEGLTLQALFTSGAEGNFQEKNIAGWIDKVISIGPRDVQIYTISRPVPSRTIAPAPAGALSEIRERLRRNGIPAEVF
jgi:wyosine [tRNA(Phe)-imidazoG37] synthetase (radical SAM superfamily)